MAEFVEVMKQRKRMCEYYKEHGDCLKCELSCRKNVYKEVCGDLIKKYPQEAEKIIMDWATEHPVKTNQEVLIETIGEKFGSEIAEMFLQKIYRSINACAFLDCKKDCKEDEPCEYCRFNNFWLQEWKDLKEEETNDRNC